ncbi:glutamate receptor ionotropic, kainate 2 isoform X2 [Nematostella vectensis]|nr:glutamate receptor ionotropic, kainate 2 isoform X2 [Nematostella vectensis]
MIAVELARAVMTPGITVDGIVEFVNINDDLENTQKAISLVDRGAVAIVGPMELFGVEAIQRFCSELQVPQVAPLTDGLSFTYNPCEQQLLTRMSTGYIPLFKAIVDLIRHYKWKKVSILTSRDNQGREGVADFQELLSNDVEVVNVEHFYVTPELIKNSLRMLLELINKGGARIVVLKCRAHYVPVVMAIAREKGMLGDWVWIFTESALDEVQIVPHGHLATRDLRGVIGVRQSIGKGLYSRSVTKHWADYSHNKPLTPVVGRVIDSVLVIAKAIQNAVQAGDQVTSGNAGLFCNLTRRNPPSISGITLNKYIQKVQTAGFMGFLSFSQDGFLANPSIDIINVKENEFDKVGEWNTKDGLMMDSDKTVVWMSGGPGTPRDSENVLADRTIRVVSFKGSPFTMPVGNVSSSVDRFEGAVIDLLDRLSEILHFNYTIYMSPDGRVGVENPVTGNWDGVINELIQERADLAVGPITITSHRWKVIDFTQPFMTSGIGVVMGTENSPKPYFRFLEPFKSDLWITIFGAVLGMGVVNWLFSVVSPFGFYGRCVQSINKRVKKSYLKQKYSLSFLNSIWSSAAYYLGQGPDGNHPVSASGRAAVAVWWFVITILGATYTANMAAFLTTTRMQTPIRRIEDLSSQTEIAYGCVENSLTQNFFQSSSVQRYQMMWEYMKLRRSLQPDTYTAIERTLKGKYAFIHDAPILEYLARKTYCGRIKLIGGYDTRTFGNAHYGFALPKKSPYTNLLSVEILKLVQSGIAKTMIEEWMIERTPCAPLDEAEEQDAKSSDTSKMGINNMLGVFIFMVAGIAIGGVLLVLEWFVAAYSDVKRDKRKRNKFVGFWCAICSRVIRSWKYRGRIAAKISQQKHGMTFHASRSTQTSSSYRPILRDNASETSVATPTLATPTLVTPNTRMKTPSRLEYNTGLLSRRSDSVEL